MALAGSPPAALAATLVVNTTQDEMTPGDGLCSLREAIAAVDAPATASDCGVADVGAPNTIVLGAQTYTLTIRPSGVDDDSTGDLDITGNAAGLTIAGAGSGTVIDASGMVKAPFTTGDRVLSVAAGANVTISDLTLSGGRAPNGLGATMAAPTPTAGSNGGGIDNAGSMMLNGVTVTNDRAGAGGGGLIPFPSGTGTGGGDGGAGGGIYSTGTLTLTNSTISSDLAGDGGLGGITTGASGGMGAGGGNGGDGGGIYSTGTAMLTDSTISGDAGGAGGRGGDASSGMLGTGEGGGSGGNGGQGGGIYDSATLDVDGSTFDTNRAGAGGRGGVASLIGGTGGNGGAGGGVQSTGANAALTVAGSTFAGNAAGDGGAGGSKPGTGGTGAPGGGISTVTGSSAVTNSTFTGNKAGNGGNAGDPAQISGNGAGGSGGGVSVDGTTSSTLLSVTLAGNAAGLGGTAASNPADVGAAGHGGGVFAAGTLLCVVGQNCVFTHLQDSIVASSGTGGNCDGRVTNGGHDLSFPAADTTCSGATSGDPLLGQLQDNGGPSPTMALGPGSAALDQVPAQGAGCPMTDQRGVPRPFGSACDIGAYEVAAPAVTTGPASAIGTNGATISGTVTANTGLAGGGATVHFNYGLTTAYGSQTALQQITGVTPVLVSAALTGLTPSTVYHYRAVAGSKDGATVGADQTFSTSAPATGGGGGGAGTSTTGTGSSGGSSSGAGSSGASSPRGGTQASGPSGTGAAAVPVLSALALSRSAFAPARAGAAIARTRPAGTTVAYTDSEAATTSFSVLSPHPGVLQGARCVKRPKHARAHHGRSCTRFTPVGSFTHGDVAGANRFHFTGRVNGHALAPGGYELSATPVAGGVTGRTRTVVFRILGSATRAG